MSRASWAVPIRAVPGHIRSGGDSNVSITAASDAVFTGAVYGGGYSSSGTSTVSGNSSLTLDGGAYAGALYAGGGGTGSSVNGDATLTVKKAVFRTGSTLNASEGTVGGTSSLLLGGYGNTADHAISFSNTAVTGFDIVTMFQDSFFTGNLNMTGSSVLALAEGQERESIWTARSLFPLKEN